MCTNSLRSQRGVNGSNVSHTCSPLPTELTAQISGDNSTGFVEKFNTLGILGCMVAEAMCTINGRVQGVGFRAYAEGEAKTCGVVGWIRNCEDGTVQTLIQGTPDQVKYFIEVLHEGSVLATVTDVAVQWRSPEKLFSDFVVKY